MLVLGASVCLVVRENSISFLKILLSSLTSPSTQTAIILSASVTFLALPGLDNAARTAGFVAILASVASLASSVIALFRHQTEVRRIASRSGEGLLYTVSTVSRFALSSTPSSLASCVSAVLIFGVSLQRGSVLMSLPAVFLAWAIIAFVSAMVLYAFRGSAATDPEQWTRFALYTKWTTVGVLGLIAGLLLTSMFFVRR